MKPDKNWGRWSLISVIKHFKVMADANSLYFHIRGTDRFTSEQDEFIEVHVQGPIITQIAKGQFRLLFGVNVLYSTDITSNYQRDTIISGLISEYFTDICVYKYGVSVDDDDSPLGILSLVQNKSDKIKINDFGLISSDVKIKQGSVEAVYEMFLDS